VELIHSGLNHIFDMRVVFMANYFLVEGDVLVDNETLLVTDFVNLKIKSAQSFRYAHKSRVYVRVFIGVSVHTYMRIYVCTVFLKKFTMFLKKYIRKISKDWEGIVLQNKFLHVRWCSHIIVNLIVKNGLDEHNDSIERTAVRFSFLLRNIV
jgi:hypothetical protein